MKTFGSEPSLWKLTLKWGRRKLLIKRHCFSREWLTREMLVVFMFIPLGNPIHVNTGCGKSWDSVIGVHVLNFKSFEQIY